MLGSSLYHPHLTTDFSESQIEFITPPFSQNIEVINFLDDLHNYVSKSIGSEYLWPLSFPPNISTEDEIRIANYGKSNLAHLKTLYRKGLAFRYGKLMQSISGIHFNFSFSDKLWTHDVFREKTTNKKDLKSGLYFKMIRNLERMNWLIIYLYGASPIIPKNFMKPIDVHHTKRGNDYYFPYATSLRMSTLGYRNLQQSKLVVSTNSLKEYINDLSGLLRQPSKSYQNGLADFSSKAEQINSNVIQIEAEYYASFRPKSKDTFSRPILSLEKNGVDILFCPASPEVYPEKFQTSVKVKLFSEVLEGKFRKGHMEGVATIVTKLFNLVRPDFAIFGEKDFQQLLLIKSFVEDLNIPVKIISGETIRDNEGLALSSRNEKLTNDEKIQAMQIIKSLNLGVETLRSGEKESDNIIKKIRDYLADYNLIQIEYVSIRDVNNFEKVNKIDEDIVILISVFIGKIRLIDNLIYRKKNG